MGRSRAAPLIGTRLPSGELPRRSSLSDPSPRSLAQPARSGAAQERWRNGYRGRVVCHILPARGARQQSTPDGLLRHIFAVASYHSLTGVAAADIYPAVTRAGPLPAEQLSACTSSRQASQAWRGLLFRDRLAPL